MSRHAEHIMIPRAKKLTGIKRAHAGAKARPAGIQSMGVKLYESIQQAIREMETTRT
jgi:hypothetical protein